MRPSVSHETKGALIDITEANNREDF